jgi:hypothetical protein
MDRVARPSRSKKTMRKFRKRITSRAKLAGQLLHTDPCAVRAHARVGRPLAARVRLHRSKGIGLNSHSRPRELRTFRGSKMKRTFVSMVPLVAPESADVRPQNSQSARTRRSHDNIDPPDCRQQFSRQVAATRKQANRSEENDET